MGSKEISPVHIEVKELHIYDRNQLLTAMGYDADDLFSFILRRLLMIIHSLLDVEL